MCNLSQGILAKGYEQGIEKGMEKGIEKGIDIATVNYVKKLMQKNNYSAEEAMDMLDVEENIRSIVLEELRKLIE